MCYDFLLFIHILGNVPSSKGINIATSNTPCVRWFLVTINDLTTLCRIGIRPFLTIAVCLGIGLPKPEDSKGLGVRQTFFIRVRDNPILYFVHALIYVI